MYLHFINVICHPKEISPTGVVTTHHHGLSTYLIDDAISPSQHYPSTRYTNLGKLSISVCHTILYYILWTVNPMGPDLTSNAYYIDRQSDDYASALRKNAYNHQLAGNTSPSPVASLQQLNVSLSPNHIVNYGGSDLLQTHSVINENFIFNN